MKFSKIDELTRSHVILEHPFLTKLAGGHYSLEQIGVWLRQQYHVSRQFPRCLAALYARLDNVEMSRPLMEFLTVEHWGGARRGRALAIFRTDDGGARILADRI